MFFKPSRDSRWKQPTPQMQVVAIRNSVEGDFSNYKEGIISMKEYLKRLYDYGKQMDRLNYFLVQGHWWN